MPQLIEGKPIQMQGSGSKPYELKNTGGVYSCTCPAWRNQSAAIDKRTCKHLKKHCGDAQELARIGGTPFPTASVMPAPTVVQPASTKHVMDHNGHTLGKTITADADYAQTILDRAFIEGRQLRQDEKAKLHGPPVLLAHSFEDFEDLDPTGWWYSEKLDGVRAYWDGQNFISRQGNVFHAPDWFKAALPKNTILDGELWIGRQQFQKTLSVVRRHDWGDGAKLVKYVVFDVPSLTTDVFETRMVAVNNWVAAIDVPHVLAHPHHRLQSLAHLLSELKLMEAGGGEGLMIRKPQSLYEVGRSATLLKVKPFRDDEGTVIAYKAGKGRHKGRLGGITVRWNSVEFDLGTGFSDEDRRNPPAIGAQVTFRYTELTKDGKPKCASFVAVRDGY